MVAGRKARVLLIDDHPVVREGMASLIGADRRLMVCGQAGDGRSALSMIASLNPDVAVLDLTLPDIDGIELIKRIRAECEPVPILVFSMSDENIYAQRSLRAGAVGYLMKGSPGEELVHAIHQVVRGKTYVSEAINEKLLHQFVENPHHANSSPEELLSDREFEVFRLIGQGYGTREVADRLHLSIKTIETYRLRIKEKLRIENTQELIRLAIHSVRPADERTGD